MNARRARQLRATAVIAAAAAAVPAATPALAAPAARPASGSATSSLTLLELRSGAAGAVQVLQAALVASTASSPHTATVGVIPLVAGGQSLGGVSVTPASSPRTAGGQSTTLPGGVATVTAPSATASAVLGAAPTARVSANALGAISMLGQQLQIADASLSAVSTVGTASSSSTKAVKVGSLALPTVLGLLKSAGLDLGALTPQQLQDVVKAVLQVVPTAVSTAAAAVTTAGGTASTTLDQAKAAVTTAQGAVATAQAAYDSAATDLAAKTSAADAAAQALASAQSALTAALGSVLPPVVPVATLQAAVTSATATSTAAQAAKAAAQAVFATAQAALQTAKDALTAAQAIVAALVALVNQVSLALNRNALAIVEGIDVETKAVAASGAQPVAQARVAAIGVDVLGTVVTGAAAGTAAIAAAVTRLNGALKGVTDALGAPVVVTPPKVEVLPYRTVIRPETASAPSLAEVDVPGVVITLPTVTVPTSLALPSAVAGVGSNGLSQVTSTVAGAADTLLTSATGRITIGHLQDTASHLSAITATTTRGTTPGRTARKAPGQVHRGRLPRTGLDAAVAGLGLLALLGAAALRRRVAVTRG